MSYSGQLLDDKVITLCRYPVWWSVVKNQTTRPEIEDTGGSTPNVHGMCRIRPVLVLVPPHFHTTLKYQDYNKP